MRVVQSLFGLPRLHAAWTFAPGGVIWRIHFSASGLIVGEARNEGQKRAHFFCLEEETGRVLWNLLEAQDPWWTGIEAVLQDVVLLHGYAQPDMPEHLGIWAYHLRDGRLLWQDPAATFWFADADRLYTLRTMVDRRVGAVLDLTTGMPVGEFEDTFEQLSGIRERSEEARIPGDMHFPLPLDLADLPAAASQRIREQLRDDAVVGGIEVINHRGKLAFNFHRNCRRRPEDPPSLENRLVILDQETGRVLFAETIQTNARAPVPDSFFLKGPRLLFVREGTTLTALPLWKSSPNG